MKLFKTLAVMAMAAALALVLAACGGNAGGSASSSASGESASASSSSASASTSSTAQALAALDGVTNVEAIDVSGSQMYAEKYLVTFEQPLDHKDPSAGTFPQRVEVGIVPDAQTNVMETDGYLLFDQQLAMDDAHELCLMFAGNYIHVEHRFFGESRPESLSNDGTDGWQYLTSENAAADYHRIYTELSKVLDGPWTATGTSRGGEVCASYAYYYPEDMGLYVPYVGPFSSGREDPRYYEFVYTKIGDEKYGAEKAKEYRDLVSSFQVELMKNKEALAPALKQFAESQGSVYREGVTDGMLFDLAVSELAVQEWQANQDVSSNPQMDLSFEGMKEVLAMPEGTADEKNAKLDAELTFLYFLASPSDWAANSIAWPYYVGAATQYGQYHYDFSYLRQACEAAGLGDVLTVKPEDEDGFLFKMVLTPEQQQAFAYDGSFYEGVTKWIDTADAKIVFIYGNSDPWYSLRMHDTGNPNVKMYVSDTKPHSVRITDFGKATMQEIGAFASEALLGK
ncbi:MAG: hypothetical protein IJ111_04930 [Eggerthellaceae bacterium]|nr:hypothetical protein [Eggerthellaceae bacterium]